MVRIPNWLQKLGMSRNICGAPFLTLYKENSEFLGVMPGFVRTLENQSQALMGIQDPEVLASFVYPHLNKQE